ncbi:vWA domain-containing protein [Myroides guanonis]|uniref:von Willebrand factor type A domain n=1 Tax=Myroides guanonis TaxID=1150112 RepID=A0A1I3LLE7_9FLAO|nr:vWA domain-containing protein [Myroides guanonis]SFI85315.1 von Willebrand factor type A domain [Myroides guanonis]
MKSKRINEFLICITLLCFQQIIYSQVSKPEKRIYLIDVTASMEGKGIVNTPDIFNEVKENLQKTVELIQDKSTEVVFIPFTSKPHTRKSFTIERLNEIKEYISKLKVEKGDTNIVDAWREGVEEIDPSKVNYLFLLTDGLHNTGPEKEQLFEYFKNWSDFSFNKYYFAFYVMLTPYAKELDIATEIDKSNQLWMIESMDVNVSFISAGFKLRTNITNSKNVKISFRSNNLKVFSSDLDVKFRLEDNPYYRIKSYKNNLKNEQSVLVELEELMPLLNTPIETDIILSIEFDKAKHPLLFFTPEKVGIEVVNKGVRTMYFKEK